MSGTLYVVATPIGNLEDITLRALRILREVAVIAAEDTRHTAKLLAHHAIATPTVSFHRHNTRTRTPQLLERLEAGQAVALVSDAGMPGISDPGVELVRACVEAGIPVDVVPGPSAVLTALIASGFPPEPVTFLGFAPTGVNARNNWLADVAGIPHTVVFFEAPHRIGKLLSAAVRLLGTRPLMLARELTKAHQEFLRGTANQLVKRLNKPRGEFTVVVGPAHETPVSAGTRPSTQAVADEFRQLTEVDSLSRRQAITSLARKYGRPSREIYAQLEEAKPRLS